MQWLPRTRRKSSSPSLPSRSRRTLRASRPAWTTTASFFLPEPAHDDAGLRAHPLAGRILLVARSAAGRADAIEVQLRESARFHNGETLAAHDFAYPTEPASPAASCSGNTVPGSPSGDVSPSRMPHMEGGWITMRGQGLSGDPADVWPGHMHAAGDGWAPAAAIRMRIWRSMRRMRHEGRRAVKIFAA